MEGFKRFFKGDKRRHMRPLSRVTRAHPGRFVPKVHQTKEENIKLRKVRTGESRFEYLTSGDFEELRRAGYKFAPSVKTPVKLGNTGIRIEYKKQLGRFILTKS